MTDPAILTGKKAAFHTFGCKLNFAETATLEAELQRRGVQRATDGERPDVVVINSCSVTSLADKKCRQLIRSINRRWTGCPIVVTGCYAQLKPEEVAAQPGVVLVEGSDRKLSMVDDIVKLLQQPIDTLSRIEVTRLQDLRKFVPSCERGERTRYFLKVQDGCDYFCSYCTIPFARGRSRSGSIESIVGQARDVAAKGGREIVLTGVNIGDFGKGTSETFFDLIRKLDEVEGIERYRISSIEPNLLTDDIIIWVAGSRSFMPHFHIPLQNGDDEVLKLMRRRYDTALFRHKIELIRQVIPDAFIGVDLIVGARGETPDRFDRSKSFVESLPISRLHVFPYSEREGTRALVDIDHVVSQEDKHNRASIMGEVSDRKLTEYLNSFVGTTRKVLFEHKSGSDGLMAGFTDNYIKVKSDCRPELFDSIIDVRLDSVDGEEIIGTIL
ncbi:MAG: tRNA (N(6)-L-threonylcarbamoyladenosine(37)-C(2))-methylthiotransferase MtaB [Bacteroides sp.]|nr:tRNA (N(6)-L-threonylcarbamoyladenosine(37)-C(2))-methylthiotransferase MtaB [Bacteroides sp.]MCM1413092.1 tRNA (N(6)-L-threonylcarbamoyladenosine(37)-C(2))-methylthiotransferase MtaB [Bacteroides sp.]MCM1472166.1 tRNA (N(6)-L-threonylcarbamoyladenosine(37)-C(2))-methylthiotransferase MtaB [Bacteroides sp.]